MTQSGKLSPDEKYQRTEILKRELVKSLRMIVIPIIILIFLVLVYYLIIPRLPLRWNQQEISEIVLLFVILGTSIFFLRRLMHLINVVSNYLPIRTGHIWSWIVIWLIGFVGSVVVVYYMVSNITNRLVMYYYVPYSTRAIANSIILFGTISVGLWKIGRTLMGDLNKPRGIPDTVVVIPPKRTDEERLKELEELLKSLDEKLIIGEISEDLYKEFKGKYEAEKEEIERRLSA